MSQREDRPGLPDDRDEEGGDVGGPTTRRLFVAGEGQPPVEVIEEAEVPEQPPAPAHPLPGLPIPRDDVGEPPPAVEAWRREERAPAPEPPEPAPAPQRPEPAEAVREPPTFDRATPAADRPAATPPPPADEPDDFAGLAADLSSRAGEESARSYAEIVQRVGSYLEQGYDLFALAGYPQTGKTHAVKALVHRLHGFDPAARAEFRRGRAPGPTEYWPFYYAYNGAQGSPWVLMDTSGDLYAKIHGNEWDRPHLDALGGLLRTVGHARGLLLLLHLTSGHLELAATGFADEMDRDEREREQKAQAAQEELDFFDNFLLLARALKVEQGKIPQLVRRAAEAPSLDEALRLYRQSPRLDVPVTVLFTQADRLMGADFAVGRGRYLAPQRGLVGVAPFVARHLPTLFDTVRRHARRFRFDFVQSYVERPSPGGGRPVWSVEGEPLSVGLVPALEYLLRRSGSADGRRGLGRYAIDTGTALRLHRLLHPRLWEGVEVEL